MNDYLLFLDTEASGLPKKWHLPYSKEGNWPFSVQVAWIIYTKNGEKVKQENHYISNDDFVIEPSATKVHGITRSYLHFNGESRHDVMSLLAYDIEQYKPLIIGHFIQFDVHMIGADFYRTGIKNKVNKENTFCTMIASKHLVQNPAVSFLRLGQLYELLFHEKLGNQHNALEDAAATAACFFELVRRGDITDDSILKQQQEEIQKEVDKQRGCVFPFILIVSLSIIICYFLW